MTTTQHTPTPWFVDNGNRIVGHETLEYTASKFIVAVVHGLTEERVSANAALIASAPDLLEALEGMVIAYESLCKSHGAAQFLEGPTCFVAAKAAIARARGEK